MYAEGLHLRRTDENVAEIDALASMLGGRLGVEDLLQDLNRRGHRSWVPARAVHRAYGFDAADRRDPRWWPQGVTTSADARVGPGDGTIGGRRVVVVAWYAKELPGDDSGNHGARLTFYDLDSRRYRHVLLVVPALRDGALSLEPLHVHAGGIVWHGPYLHVAATARGFHTARLDDLLRIPDEVGAVGVRRLGVREGTVAAHGYRYLLPVRFAYQPHTDEGFERLRFSFLSLDRAADPPELIAGEYARGRKTRRLARFPMDPETLLLATEEDRARPLELGEGVAQMQGAAVARGRWHLTASRGPWVPGSVFTGRPGDFREHRWATPMGPEDLSSWPERDELWSVSEHPRRRWIYSMRRSWFDRD